MLKLRYAIWHFVKAYLQHPTTVIGILNRHRKNLALEMKDDPALPRDLEGQVFGYLDLLEKTCADARAKGAEVEQIPPSPETPSGTSP